jgi:hypothetical protein
MNGTIGNYDRRKTQKCANCAGGVERAVGSSAVPGRRKQGMRRAVRGHSLQRAATRDIANGLCQRFGALGATRWTMRPTGSGGLREKDRSALAGGFDASLHYCLGFERPFGPDRIQIA